MIRDTLTILAGAVLLTAAAHAQVADKDAVKPGEVVSNDTGTRNLNQQAAAEAEAQNAANAASSAEFTQSVNAYEAARATVAADRVAYEAALEVNRQARAAYDVAYARWQADVAACTAGEIARCRAPTSPK